MSTISYRSVILISFLAIFAQSNAMEKLPENSQQSTKATLNADLEAKFKQALLNYFAAQNNESTNNRTEAINYMFEDETNKTIESETQHVNGSGTMQNLITQFSIQPSAGQPIDNSAQGVQSKLYFDEKVMNNVIQKKIESEKIKMHITKFNLPQPLLAQPIENPSQVGAKLKFDKPEKKKNAKKRTKNNIELKKKSNGILEFKVSQPLPAQPIDNSSQVVLNPENILRTHSYGTKIKFDKSQEKTKTKKRNKKISEKITPTNIIEFNRSPAKPIDNSSQVLLKKDNRWRTLLYGTKLILDEPQKKRKIEETEEESC